MELYGRVQTSHRTVSTACGYLLDSPVKRYFLPAILVSSSLALTARLETGSRARLIPLTGPKTSLGVPSLRQAQEAVSIKLQEIGSQYGDDKHTKNPKDWLALLVREVISKYLVSIPHAIF